MPWANYIWRHPVCPQIYAGKPAELKYSGMRGMEGGQTGRNGVGTVEEIKRQHEEERREDERREMSYYHGDRPEASTRARYGAGRCNYWEGSS